MDGPYTIQQFAAEAGVTVKTLRHYDRLGLLKPKRSAAGYRIYVRADLERLTQVAALKSLGFPLRRIGGMLDRAPVSLSGALAQQRRVLIARRDSLNDAIAAIEESGQPGVPGSALRKLIEVLDLRDEAGGMRCYYKQEHARAKAMRFWIQWPSEERARLYRDVETAATDDRTLAGRWLALEAREHRADPDFRGARFSPGRIATTGPRRCVPAPLRSISSGFTRFCMADAWRWYASAGPPRNWPRDWIRSARVFCAESWRRSARILLPRRTRHWRPNGGRALRQVNAAPRSWRDGGA